MELQQAVVSIECELPAKMLVKRAPALWILYVVGRLKDHDAMSQYMNSKSPHNIQNFNVCCSFSVCVCAVV